MDTLYRFFKSATFVLLLLALPCPEWAWAKSDSKISRPSGEAGSSHFANPLALNVSPGDEFWSSQWNLTSTPQGISAEGAWNYSTGTNVVVAVLDSGYAEIPDMEGQWALPGYDFVDNDTDARDNYINCLDSEVSWHGLGVSSLIAAKANSGSGSGISGAAPTAKILPIRVSRECANGYHAPTQAELAEYIRWAAGLHSPLATVDNIHPAKIINLSFKLPSLPWTTCEPVLENAITEVNSLGSIVVVASGNQGYDKTLVAPANCLGVISIAATDSDGNVAEYSNLKKSIFLSAPGGTEGGSQSSLIPVWYVQGRTGAENPAVGFVWGTSFSAPTVSAVLALLEASVSPPPTRAQKLEAIRVTAKPLASPCRIPNSCGAGIIDADKAVRFLQAKKNATFSEDFSSKKLSDKLWTSFYFNGQPAPEGYSLVDGVLTVFDPVWVVTDNKYVFGGKKIVVEARISSPEFGHDSKVMLSDVQTGDQISAGDTDYRDWGLYIQGSGLYAFNYPSFTAPTTDWMEYRLTVDGDMARVERGVTLDSISQTLEIKMPTSAMNRYFSLRLSTGSVPWYAPAAFDWVRVRVKK